MPTPVNRARDEEILRWVKTRAGGKSAASIAAQMGLTRASISLVTKQIKDTNIAENGEPEASVAAAYWSEK